MRESFAQRIAASLDDVSEVLYVELLLPDERRHLCGLVVGVLVDDAHRADDRSTAQAEVVAALARVLLAVQRVGQSRRTVLTLHRLQRTTFFHDLSFVFGGLPEPNRACLVGVW